MNWKIAVALKTAREAMDMSVEEATDATGYDASEIEAGVWPDPAVPVAYWRNLTGTKAGFEEAVKAVSEDQSPPVLKPAKPSGPRTPRRNGQCQWDFSDVDWSMSNSRIAALKKCSASTVRNYRVRLAPQIQAKREISKPKRQLRARTIEIFNLLAGVDWTISDTVLSLRTGIDQCTVRRHRRAAASKGDPLIMLAGLKIAYTLQRGYAAQVVPSQISSMVEKSGRTIYFDIRYIRWVYATVVAGEALPARHWCIKALELLAREGLVKPCEDGGWERT